jgi:hypothetical protein
MGRGSKPTPEALLAALEEAEAAIKSLVARHAWAEVVETYAGVRARIMPSNSSLVKLQQLKAEGRQLAAIVDAWSRVCTLALESAGHVEPRTLPPTAALDGDSLLGLRGECGLLPDADLRRACMRAFDTALLHLQQQRER